jgi:hypothetical protein
MTTRGWSPVVENVNPGGIRRADRNVASRARSQTQDHEGPALGRDRLLAIHVVEGTAAPADEVSPSRIHVVAGPIVETGPEIALGATTGFAGIAAFVFSCPTLFAGFLASFFVSHVIAFRLSGLGRHHITR